MEEFVVELEDVIDYLLLAVENDKPFVNCNHGRVALWYKTMESPCAPATNVNLKPDPESLFLQAQERRVKEQQGKAIQSLLDALLPE